MLKLEHNAFSRETLVRETIHVSLAGPTCSWCNGQSHLSSNGPSRLFRYSTVKDDDLRQRKNPIKGLFCSIDCCRSYHS